MIEGPRIHLKGFAIWHLPQARHVSAVARARMRPLSGRIASEAHRVCIRRSEILDLEARRRKAHIGRDVPQETLPEFFLQQEPDYEDDHKERRLDDEDREAHRLLGCLVSHSPGAAEFRALVAGTGINLTTSSLPLRNVAQHREFTDLQNGSAIVSKISEGASTRSRTWLANSKKRSPQRPSLHGCLRPHTREPMPKQSQPLYWPIRQ